MWPHLHPAGVAISSWAFFAVVASLVATAIGLQRLRALSRRDDVAAPFQRTALQLEFAVVILLGGWLAAKAAHVLFEAEGHVLKDGSLANGVLDLLRDDPLHWARLLEPGFVFYGGILGGAAVASLWLWRQGLAKAIPSLVDEAGPAVVVGAFLGRVGCFLGGCCYGVATDLPWAVHYPHTHPTAGVGVHPTQGYDMAGALLALMVWGFLMDRRRRGHWPRWPKGLSGVAALMVVAGVRLVSEVVRGDPGRGGLGPLSTSQWISAMVCVLGVAVGAVAYARFRASTALGRTP